MDGMGKRISVVRGPRTQAEFAEVLGCSFNAVCKWENGKNYPSTELIAVICETFEVSPEWIFCGEAEE